MPTIDKKVVQLKNTSDELLDPIPALAKPGSVGGVLATAKTTEMTQPVGIDENGALWTTPGGGAEVTINPYGGLKNSDNGLGIKTNETTTTGSGLSLSPNGVHVTLAYDNGRGGIVGTSKTEEQTEAVGIGSDGILYTKPIGGTGDIEIDPAGGLEKGSAGYGLMLGANSGLTVDENGLKIKPDTAGANGSGVTLTNNGLKVTNNIMPFRTTNTASDSFTDVRTNIIQGLKLNGQSVQAQFSFYGTTTKALTISDAATVLGTSSGLKGSFVAIGMMNYNAQKYPVFVQVNTSGNIELYRVGLDSITIGSGKTINISAIAVNYGGAV